jgi:hypothetical protein
MAGTAPAPAPRRADESEKSDPERQNSKRRSSRIAKLPAGAGAQNGPEFAVENGQILLESNMALGSSSAPSLTPDEAEDIISLLGDERLESQTSSNCPASKTQSLLARNCIIVDGETFLVRKLMSLVLIQKKYLRQKNCCVPWKTAVDAERSAFPGSKRTGHGIRYHNKYWKTELKENKDRVEMLSMLYYHKLKENGFFKECPEGITSDILEIVNQLPLPEGLDLEKKGANEFRRQQGLLFAAVLKEKLVSAGKKCTLKVIAAAASYKTKLNISCWQIQRFLSSKKSVPSARGRPTKLPPAFEVHLIGLLTKLRDQKFTLYRFLVKNIINDHLKELGEQNPMPNGVHNKWFNNFLSRHNFSVEDMQYLDMRREKWVTSENLFRTFDNLADALVKFKIAVLNPNWKGRHESRNVPRLLFCEGEEHRLWEFDETRFQVGAGKAPPKTTKEKIVVSKTTNDREVVTDSVSSSGVSGMLTVRGDGHAMPPGFVFDKGDNAELFRWIGDDELRHLWDVQITLPNGTLKKTNPFYGSNEKGSFNVEMLLAYLKHCFTVLEEKPTADKPILLYIDGVSTHISFEVTNWCKNHHVEIILKCPYASHVLQSMDLYGGHFQLIKREFRININRRIDRLRLRLHSDVRNSRRSLKTQLDLKDFIPAVKGPFTEFTHKEKNQELLKRIGVLPFTMRPAYKCYDEHQEKVSLAQSKKKKKWQKKRKLDAYSELLDKSEDIIKNRMGFLEPSELKVKAHDAEDDAAEEDLEAYIKNIELGTTKDTAGKLAAINYVMEHCKKKFLSEEERDKLIGLLKRKNYNLLTAGSVWSSFNGHASGDAHLAWQGAVRARKAGERKHMQAKRRVQASNERRKTKNNDITAIQIHTNLDKAHFSMESIAAIKTKHECFCFYAKYCKRHHKKRRYRKEKDVKVTELRYWINNSDYVKDKRNVLPGRRLKKGPEKMDL